VLKNVFDDRTLVDDGLLQGIKRSSGGHDQRRGSEQDKAWSFDVKVDESSFVDTLVLVLETLAGLPYNNSLQP